MDRKQSVEIFSVDSALVGLWHVGAINFRIDADGWYYISVGALPYQISPDGQTPSYPSTETITQYQRILGSGTSLVGVWEREELEGADIWTEEIHFRANGTYTFQWLLNGVFEFEGLGNYTDQTTSIWSEERRAIIETASPDILSFHFLYAPVETGTYNIRSDGNQWTYSGPGGDVVYDRI